METEYAVSGHERRPLKDRNRASARRHFVKFAEDLSLEDGAMGFFTSKGRFVSMVEASQVAFEAGQIDERTAKWSEELAEQLNNIQYIGQKPTIVVAGDWKPLASEDLY